MSNKINWNEENTQKLVELAGTGVVSQELLVSIAEELGTSARSVGAKLRKMDFEVAKAAPKSSAWTTEQEAELESLVTANANNLTYAEIAATFQGGAFTAKQVQGKLLSMELFGLVRKADKKVAVRKYSEEEEARFIELANGGATIEALAEAFGKEVPSIRGKALSLHKAGQIAEMPKQEVYSNASKDDVLKDLDVTNMTVEQLVEKTGRSARGIKSMLTHRGISCEDYDGESKRAKLDSAK